MIAISPNSLRCNGNRSLREDSAVCDASLEAVVAVVVAPTSLTLAAGGGSETEAKRRTSEGVVLRCRDCLPQRIGHTSKVVAHEVSVCVERHRCRGVAKQSLNNLHIRAERRQLISSVLSRTDWGVMRAMTNTADTTWLTRTEFAERIGVPAKTTAEWATKGTGPRYARFGRHVRYRLTDVIAWENQQFADLFGER